ncbi:hypothetical protein AB0280_01710 [Pseudarthrobacter sp902506025]|uniref:YozE SAM-like domain-containing protein n=1 Tax=Pseudarthrobacter defluvii TaxID=410837 RepID=A0ABT9UI22_9MICC|nr:hypothetical protein [Pseudarthrobacter defluvii]MDQ0118691.1 hypothetical protein [Pseudarthrobacter defluvii]
MEWTRYARTIAKEFAGKRPENFVDLWLKYQDYGGVATAAEFHALINGTREASQRELFLLKAAFEDIAERPSHA